MKRCPTCGQEYPERDLMALIDRKWGVTWAGELHDEEGTIELHSTDPGLWVRAFNSRRNIDLGPGFETLFIITKVSINPSPEFPPVTVEVLPSVLRPWEG